MFTLPSLVSNQPSDKKEKTDDTPSTLNTNDVATTATSTDTTSDTTFKDALGSILGTSSSLAPITSSTINSGSSSNPISTQSATNNSTTVPSNASSFIASDLKEKHESNEFSSHGAVFPSNSISSTTKAAPSTGFGGFDFALPSLIVNAEEPTTSQTQQPVDTSLYKERPETDNKATSEMPLHESVQSLLHSVQQQRNPLTDFDMMSEIDQKRYKLYLRTKLADADKLLAHLSSLPMKPRINPSVAHIMSLILKEMAGDIVLLALQVRKERCNLYKSEIEKGKSSIDTKDEHMDQLEDISKISDSKTKSKDDSERILQGPLTSDEIYEAYRRWREKEAKIGRDKWKNMKKKGWRR